MTARSPIEMMVDKACGFDPSKQKTATLRCPRCKTEKQVALVSSEPVETAVMELPCHNCWRDGEVTGVSYFDANGKPLPMP